MNLQLLCKITSGIESNLYDCFRILFIIIASVSAFVSLPRHLVLTWKNNPQTVNPHIFTTKKHFTKSPLTQLFVLLGFITPTDNPYNSPSCQPGADHHPYHSRIGLIVRLAGDFLGKLRGGTHLGNQQKKSRHLRRNRKNARRDLPTKDAIYKIEKIKTRLKTQTVPTSTVRMHFWCHFWACFERNVLVVGVSCRSYTSAASLFTGAPHADAELRAVLIAACHAADSVFLSVPILFSFRTFEGIDAYRMVFLCDRMRDARQVVKLFNLFDLLFRNS